jgi:signal transduction histidine kinase
MAKSSTLENDRLRRTLSDLVTLTALPFTWSEGSGEILASLAEVVRQALSLDLVYVRVTDRQGAGSVEAVRWQEDGARKAPPIGPLLEPLLADPLRPAATIPHPGGGGPLRAVVTRFGLVEQDGLLVTGSLRPEYPDDQEQLLLTIAANQAVIAIDNAQLYGQAQREIADRRRLEESERAARTQAERATRLRDEFLATVSHELRTPLNSVLGWTQVLRKTATNEATRRRALEAIERGARAQIRLIEDLLDMSRIISGKLRLEVQPVELPPIVQAAIETVLPAAEAKDIRIQRILDPFDVPIQGDPARLQQIFWNLLSNALKFTPKGGQIQVHLERTNSHIEVSISDDGQGIAPEYLPAVFDRFSQEDTSTTRHHGGLGLGLAVVKHLVELHGGQVQAQSLGVGCGATFTVCLPIVRPAT